jgi:hypothetical protein
MTINTFAIDDDLIPVSLVPRNITSPIPGPHRDPVESCPVSLQYDWVNNSLLFSSELIDACSYSIFDEDDELLSQGILDFTDENTVSVNLSGFNESYYLIQIVINGVIYEGMLDF